MNQHYGPPAEFSQVASLRKALFKTEGLIFGEQFRSGPLGEFVATQAKKFRHRIFSLGRYPWCLCHAGDERR
jgi:hypothetical protein